MVLLGIIFRIKNFAGIQILIASCCMFFCIDPQLKYKHRYTKDPTKYTNLSALLKHFCATWHILKKKYWIKHDIMH